MPPRTRRTTSKRTPPKEIQKPGHALVKVRIGNRTYDAVRDSSCHTCMHPARLEIEEKLVQGHSYRAIAALYSGTEWTNADGTRLKLPEINERSIFHHMKTGHLPVETAALRQIAEERAKEMGQKYEEMTASLVDGYTFSKQVLAITQQKLASGELHPDVKDGLAAAKLIKEFEDTAQGNVDTEAWAEAMTIFFETAQNVMPPEMWSQFGSLLSQNPILAAIQNRINGQDQEDVMEGEVVS